MKPAVSILISVYKVGQFIERCAESLFGQTFESIEYIFVDDASPDDSVARIQQVLDRYPHRKPAVRILRHPVNRGISYTRITALNAAGGEYLWFVDGDDYIEPAAVETAYRKATESRADIVVFAHFRAYSEKGARVVSVTPSEKEQYLGNILACRESFCIWNKLFARKLFIDHGVSFAPGVNYGEDYAIVPRLVFYAEKMVFLNTPLYHYTLFNSSAYTRKFRRESMGEMAEGLRLISDFLRTEAPGRDYSEFIRHAAIHVKINLLRLYGCSAAPDRAILLQLDDLFSEIGLKELLWGAPLPYWPVIFSARLHLRRILPLYCRLCRSLNQLRFFGLISIQGE